MVLEPEITSMPTSQQDTHVPDRTQARSIPLIDATRYQSFLSRNWSDASYQQATSYSGSTPVQPEPEALTLTIVVNELRQANIMPHNGPYAYEYAEENYVKEVIRKMETSSHFALTQKTYLEQVAKSLPKVHLRLFVYQLATFIFNDDTDPRDQDVFERQLEEPFDRATSIAQEKEIELELKSIQFPANSSREVETARDVAKDFRLIGVLDSEALEVQKELSEIEVN